MQRVSVLEIHSYEQILLVGELISTEHQNEVQRFKTNYFGIFLSKTMVRTHVAPLSDCCHNHSCVA